MKIVWKFRHSSQGNLYCVATCSIVTQCSFPSQVFSTQIDEKSDKSTQQIIRFSVSLRWSCRRRHGLQCLWREKRKKRKSLPFSQCCNLRGKQDVSRKTFTFHENVHPIMTTWNSQAYLYDKTITKYLKAKWINFGKFHVTFLKVIVLRILELRNFSNFLKTYIFTVA